MTEVLSVAVVCLTVLLALRWHAHPLLERYLGLLERRHGVGAGRVVQAMPADLEMWAASHSEGWSREDAAQFLAEQYDEYGDWGKVRIAVKDREAA